MTPVIVWTVKDLSSREREELSRLAQGVISKSAGAKGLIDELEAYVPRKSVPDGTEMHRGR